MNLLLTQIEDIIKPYIITLTDEERKTIAKISDKSVAFVNKVTDYCSSNPQYVPAFMSADDLKTDISNYSKLHPVLSIVEQIANQLDDTAMVAGSEAYLSSLMYYSAVKVGDKNKISEAKAIYEDLSKRFPGRPKKKEVVTA